MSRMLRGAAAGLALGVAWGALARVFMRLLATEPSFSGSGWPSMRTSLRQNGSKMNFVQENLAFSKQEMWFFPES